VRIVTWKVPRIFRNLVKNVEQLYDPPSH
jgi:hypothetical protein